MLKKQNESTPLVSIGLPVFNGEKYLERALESILSQTYSNFEIIIADNASTDSTAQICRKYAVKDKRIKYYRNKRNIGSSMNFNRLLKLSSGEYFKWACHDDVHAPDYISQCVNVLNQDQSIVLCHSKTMLIDKYDSFIGAYNLHINVDSQKPHERFGDIIMQKYPAHILMNGLIRRETLNMTRGYGYYIGADRNLLAEISLIGRIYTIPKYLFFRRAHEQTYSERKFTNYKDRYAWWTNVEKISFPFYKILIEYIRSVKRMSLEGDEKRSCYAQIFRWLFREGFILIIIDVLFNLFTISNLGRKIVLLARFKIMGLKRIFRVLSSIGILE